MGSRELLRVSQLGPISSSRCQITRKPAHEARSLRKCFLNGRNSQPPSGSIANRNREAVKVGGARRDRTDDLLLAKQALSQLSYGPLRLSRSIKWWAWEDLNFRPHAYQARALTN